MVSVAAVVAIVLGVLFVLHGYFPQLYPFVIPNH